MSCYGLFDGSAFVGNITGGMDIAVDATAGSQTNDTAFNLASGSYTVTISDQKGCSKDTLV